MSLHRNARGHQIGCRRAQSLGCGLMKHDPFVVAVAQSSIESGLVGGVPDAECVSIDNQLAILSATGVASYNGH
jgi:hypothetical protein